eukprot:CAMPEP_0172906948 /NCGR_PEP_ID=MMETSP1075-20121228/177867_1 /TAXON_ID=2916 /ORGANISM="Ceratium fusus, Strain PA161109" /LENGTH=120 /DNA_ID=CAMNT_0013764473 /DNA_START=92 /DNA_END=451 /DNA_ORIENTATION=+
MAQGMIRQAPIHPHSADPPNVVLVTAAPSGKDHGGSIDKVPNVADPTDKGALISGLKRTLLNKFGTPYDAFRWFDFNNRGVVSRSMWGTGLKVINVDAVFLANTNMFFKAADTDDNGEIN